MQEQENATQQTKRKPKWYIDWRLVYEQTYPTVVAEITHPTLSGAITYHRRGRLTQGLPQLYTYIQEFQPVLQEQVDILNGKIPEDE